MVGPTCKQCEAKIDPLLLNPQRIPVRAASAAGSCTSPNGPKVVKFWEEEPPPPDSAKVRRQKSLANVKKAMGPDWYPKKKKRRSRPRKLTTQNAKYIEQKKQQKSK
ncbi:hypothetical protein PInf_022870 [Phytophthora infestans]|nr:hypothetical protein PInf_022870 [Phytophthora infestans]